MTDLFSRITFSGLLFSVMGVFVYWFYTFIVYPKYEYMGWLYVEGSAETSVALWCGLVGLLYSVIVKSESSLTQLFLTLYFNICLLPSVVFLVASDMSLVLKLYFGILLLLYPFIQLIVPQIRVQSIGIFDLKYFKAITAFGALVVFMAIPPKLDFLQLQSVSELYDIRARSRVERENAGLLLNYAYMLLFKVAAPLGFSYALVKKHHFSGLCLSLVFFAGGAASGHKSLFLTPIAILAVFTCLEKNWTFKWSVPIALFLVALMSVSGVELVQFIFGEVFWRRVVLMPGMLTQIYFDFFFSQDFFLFSDSVDLFSRADERPIAYMVGEDYFGRARMSANANFVASGYAEAGGLGVLIYCLLISVFINILSSGSGAEKRIYLLASVPIFLAILETNLTTVLVTHGLLILIILKLIASVRSEYQR